MGSDNKILQGAREALAFARGDCSHEWERLQTRIKDGKIHTTVSECKKCGVRMTCGADHSLSPDVEVK